MMYRRRQESETIHLGSQHVRCLQDHFIRVIQDDYVVRGKEGLQPISHLPLDIGPLDLAYQNSYGVRNLGSSDYGLHRTLYRGMRVFLPRSFGKFIEPQTISKE